MQAATPTVSIRRATLELPRPPWRALPIALITLLAGLLRLVSLGGTSTNPFYDAAVRSMGQSWHNFFFAAFEPGAATSIDKPPVDLWLQVATTKLFGFNTTALLLPQALAATIAVPLLYDLVRRIFGRPAGLAAAVTLAVLPLSVLTARSDTMDSLMMALSVLAAWLVVRAAQSGRGLPLYLAAAVMGLNFEVKLFEALLALPALVLLYLIAARERPIVPLARLAVSGVVFAAAALWWPTIVSLSPSRPFSIGSSNGSIWNAILVFNGQDRFNGPGIDPAALPNPPGIGRLFQFGGYHLAQNLGTALAPALIFAIAAALALVARRRSRAPGTPLFADRRLAVAGAAAAAVWVAVCFAVFSHSRGVLHARYLEAMTPGIAILLGAGAVTLVRLAARSIVALAGLSVALAAAALWAVRVSESDHRLALVAAIAAGAAALGGAASWLLRRRGTPAAAAALVATGCLALFAALVPGAVRSLNDVRIHDSDAGAPGHQSPHWITSVSSYLTAHQGSAHYEAAAVGYGEAGALIAHDGRPVLVLTSATRSTIVSLAALESKARTGAVRYAIIGGTCGRDVVRDLRGRCPDTVQWIRHHAVDVSAQAGLRDRGVIFRIVLPAAPSRA